MVGTAASTSTIKIHIMASKPSSGTSSFSFNLDLKILNQTEVMDIEPYFRHVEGREQFKDICVFYCRDYRNREF